MSMIAAMKLRLRTRLIFAMLFVSLLSALFGPIIAFDGDAGACYNVQDSDARTYCLARARGDVSQCYSIQRSDMRSQCLAEVRN